MASGGYNAPSLNDTPMTGFGSDSREASVEGGPGSHISSAPLFGVDYKRRVLDRVEAGAGGRGGRRGVA